MGDDIERCSDDNGLTRRALLAGIAGAVAATSPNMAQAANPSVRKLLLGAGGIRGAFEAGAIKRLLELGYQPTTIYGVSVGGLNAAFLADRSFFLNKSKQDYFAGLGKPVPVGVNPSDLVNWAFIGDELLAFWRETITGSQVLMKKRRGVGFVSAIFRKYNGLVDMSPMRELIKSHLSAERIRRGVTVEVAAVNIDNGTVEYFANADPNFLEGVMASAAVPTLMPLVEINRDGVRKRYCDGGLREILPTAIGTKSIPGNTPTHLICVVCQSVGREYGRLQEAGNPIKLILRYSEIASEEILRSNLNVLAKSNIKHIVIRPEIPVNVDRETRRVIEIDSFDSSHISAMLDTGAWYASNILGNPSNRFVEDGYRT